MKEQDDRLTLQDTEQLCRLYMDCRLSVMEETELRYVLTQVDYRSPLIDEVRQMMEIDAFLSDNPLEATEIHKKSILRKWIMPIGIAASIAVIFSIGIFLLKNSSIEQNSTSEQYTDQPYYIAYVDGQRLGDEAARAQIEAEQKSADDLIAHMSELEAREQQIIDNFPNL